MASLANLIPSDVLSVIIEEDLRKAQVFADVCNRKYEGYIRNAGDSVKIPVIGDVTVNTHTVNGTLTYESLDSASTTLLVDQKKYFAFVVDDSDSAQALADVTGAYASRAAYNLRDTADQYIAALYGSAGVTSNLGTTATPLTITAAASSSSNIGVHELIGRVAKGLDENNVPQEGRWMIIPPWFHTKLVMAGILTLGTTDQAALTNGRVGRVMGFDMRVSTNVTNYNTTGSKIMAGIADAISYADQLVNVESLRLETKFGTGVRGLHLYGAKVTQSKALATATVSEATG